MVKSSFSSPAILLRRIEHGDHDLIISLFTRERGKISVIAKNAKRSVRRFSGALELFATLHVECKKGRGRLPVLLEASLVQPHVYIRSDIKKTAYASYWMEILNKWLEEGKQQLLLYRLLQYVLDEVDAGSATEEELSILFQMRFLMISGLMPNLEECSNCRISLEEVGNSSVGVDLKKGGIVCDRCLERQDRAGSLSKGTIKQLLWVANSELEKAGRAKFAKQAVREGLSFLEAFVIFHLGSEPRSLQFIRGLRRNYGPGFRGQPTAGAG